MQTIDLKYFGHTISLADLPQYRKFYGKLAAGTWEPRTFETLGAALDRDTVYIDIGGWIGVTPFWASRIAKAVIAVEPDPACLAILTELAPLYPNVTVIAGALSPETRVTIHAVEEFGSSETSILDIGDGAERSAKGRSFAQILAPVRDEPLFVKVDIEGYEYTIREEIERLAGYRLKGLQVALHPQLFEKTLTGPAITRRAKTLAETARLCRMFGDRFPPPRIGHYAGLADYLARGILAMRSPRGADAVYMQKASRRLR
ncbi:FkbM family methyltransferase [soil metagenome]